MTMKILNLILSVSLLCLLASCSQGSGSKATLAVSIAGLSALDVDGGFVITGKSDKGVSVSHVLTTGDSVTLDLPNGTWNFLAISWDGGAPFAGVPRCAYQTAVKLEGAAVQVELPMSLAKCFDGTVNEIAGRDTNADTIIDSFLTPSLQFCRTPVASIVSGTDNCNYQATNANSKRASVGAVRYVVKGTNGTNLQSACGTGGMSALTALQFPVVKSAFHWPAVLESFFEASCATPKKLEATIGSAKVRAIEYGTTQRLYAEFNDAEVCALADRLSITTLGGLGVGDAVSPYSVCNLAQFHDWQRNFTGPYTTANVQLLRDITFLGGVNVVNATGITPFHQCLPSGSTFIPIGHTVAAYPTCTHSTTATAFNGTLNGLGRQLSHFDFRKPEDVLMNDVGLFGALGGSSTVANLKLNGFNAEGNFRVGALAGDGAGIIENIDLKRGDIEGVDYVGGIIGKTTSSLSKVFVSESRIEGETYVGGVVGQATSINEAGFSGLVHMGNFSNSDKVGGVAGQANTVTNAFSTGLVNGLLRLGGIVGSANTVTFARSTAVISNHEPGDGNKTGGIAGEILTNLDNSYFAGAISATCSSGVACQVGTLTGVGTVGTYTWSLEVPGVFGGTLGGEDGTQSGDIEALFSVASNTLCPGGACSGTPEWTKVSGDLPRLAFEDHPCELPENVSTLSNQNTVLGRGTAANPVSICNRTQLAQMHNSPLHAKLMDSVHALDSASSVDLVAPLEGNHQFIYGGHNDSGNYTLFNVIAATGSIRNTKLVGFKAGTSGNDNTATLAFINNGVVFNVAALAYRLKGSANVAGLVINNSGIINQVKTEGSLEGEYVVGGIACNNSGTIQSATSRGNIFNPLTTGSASDFGGIVAVNNLSGIVKASSYDGAMDLASAMPNPIITRAGGIVGWNKGTVQDVLFGDDADVFLNIHASTAKIGGIVGQQDATGTLLRSVSLGRVIRSGNLVGSELISSIVDDPDGTSSFNFARYPALGFVGMPSVTTSPNAGLCDGTISGLGNGTYFFELGMSKDLISGTVTAGTTLSYLTPSLGGCYSGSANAYNSFEAVTPPTVALLTAGGYSVADMNTPAGANAVLNAYLSYFQGTLTAAPAVWMYEDDELRVFNFDD